MPIDAPNPHPTDDGGPSSPPGDSFLGRDGANDVRPDLPEYGPNAAPRWTPFVLLIIAVLMALDMVEDAQGADAFSHLLREAAVLLLSVGAASALLVRTRRSEAESRRIRQRAHRLTGDLLCARADTARWRTEAELALAGLGAAIDAQFDRWELTPAEREVGLLLLKGLSLKEIADLRASSERTVRQQASVVYHKAGLAGRAELSAFFLEDLLLPRP